MWHIDGIVSLSYICIGHSTSRGDRPKGWNAECLISNCMIMATPIAPTPELTGRAAEKFLEEMAENRKASPEEKARIKANAQWVRERMDFDF